jgi:conjugative transfer region protein TrbK
MQTKTVVRIGAIAFVAAVIAVSAMQARMTSGATAMGLPGAPDAARVDPLWPDLVRCQSIGAAGATDHACLRAWSENRRRFLAPGARPEADLPASTDRHADLGQDPAVRSPANGSDAAVAGAF